MTVTGKQHLPCGCVMAITLRDVGVDGSVNVLKDKDFLKIKVERCRHCKAAYIEAIKHHEAASQETRA